MTDIAWMGAASLAAAYRTRALSPVDVVEALLSRIDSLDGALNAFILLDRDGALAAARAAEAELTAGRDRGALHGIPLGVKDIIDVAGLPTTCHSAILKDNVAKSDAAVVARLRGAGMIPMGKLSTHEFAIGGPSFDLPFKPARNPWNSAHHPGGSSSGSGAGLAAGFFPLALAESAALLLDAMAGHDAADPGSAPGPAMDAAGRLRAGIRGLRIGFVRHFHETDMAAHPDVAAGLEGVAGALRQLGATVTDVTLPPLADFIAVNRVILAAEAWSIHAPWLRSRPGDYGALARKRLMTGAFIGAGDYVGAQRARLAMIRAVNEAFERVDVLLCASSLDPACQIDDAAEVGRTYSRQCRMPFNVTGHPALAMMSGLSQQGLPISVQFVGPYHADALLLRVAAAYEQVAAWRSERPELAAA